MNSFKVSLHLLGFSLKCCWPIRLSLESPGLTTEAKRTFNKVLLGGLMCDSQWLEDSCIVFWDVSHTFGPIQFELLKYIALSSLNHTSFST